MQENDSNKLTLRFLRDDDISLMERWLYTPHVAKWYLHPEHYLAEIRGRHEKFSFLTHFIAEYEGTPIGFCQYYDCYFSQEHEIWSDCWHALDNKGDVFSLDYLIGEPEFLRRGFGGKMISLMLEDLRKLGAKKVIVQPEAENAASNNALEANGFKKSGEDYILEL